MLMDLKSPIAEGQEVPLTLVFEHADRKRESVVVKAPARGLGEAADHHHGHKH
jgi:copper(I)-binding protein